MYRPELDLLRLLAFLLVFSHHSMDFFPDHPTLNFVGAAAASGLQLFFLLSSYLITELLLRERETTGSIHLRAFFMRRVLRIWPLYFLAIGGALAVSHFTHFGVITGRQFLFYLLLAGNWWSVFHGFIPTVIGPLWSISVEEQYYVLWPLLGRLGGRRALAVAAGLCLMVSTVALVHLGSEFASKPAVWSNSFVEFEFFSLGAILALILHNRTFHLPAFVRPLMLIAAATAMLSAEMKWGIIRNAHSGVTALLCGYNLVAVGVVLLFLAFYAAPVPTWSEPFLFLGKISYGLYVFHDLAIRLVYRLGHRYNSTGASSLKCAVALAVCIGIASLSYRWIELPFLHLKKRFTFIPNRAD